MVFNGGNSLFNGPDFFLLFIDIVSRNTFDFDLKQSFNVFFCHLANQFIGKGKQGLTNC